MILQIGKNKFRFYYSKGCFRILSNKEDEVEKMKVLILGLDSYNKYVRRQLKFQFDTLRIYSKITSLTEQERDSAMKAISKSFEGNDKLEPLRFLFIFLNDIDKQHFIMKQPSTQKIKEFSTMLIPIVTVLISILQLLLSKSR